VLAPCHFESRDFCAILNGKLRNSVSRLTLTRQFEPEALILLLVFFVPFSGSTC